MALKLLIVKCCRVQLTAVSHTVHIVPLKGRSKADKKRLFFFKVFLKINVFFVFFTELQKLSAGFSMQYSYR